MYFLVYNFISYLLDKFNIQFLYGSYERTINNNNNNNNKTQLKISNVKWVNTPYNLSFPLLYEFVKHNLIIVEKTIRTIKTNLLQKYCLGVYPVTSCSGQEWLNTCPDKM